MKKLVLGLNAVWYAVGRSIGMLFGGFIIGFMRGIDDQTNLLKSIRYEKHMKSKEADKE